MPGGRRLIAGALAECVRPGGPSVRARHAVAAGLGAELLRAGAWHRIAGTLADWMIADGDVPRDLATQAWALAEYTGRARQRAQLELERVVGALELRGVPWVVVKGPVLAHLYYPDPAVRGYQDLDVVVPARAFGDAVGALEDAGYEVADRNWELMTRELIAQVHLFRPGGVGIDLHWHLLSNRRLRASFAVSMDEVFARAEVVPIGGLSCNVMTWAHQVVHLCLHAALGGADRLGWLVDVAHAADAGTDDWEAVVEVARRWQVGLVVGAVLARAHRHVEAPVPKGVLEELLPRRAWRLLVAGVDRLWPPFVATDRGSPASLLARSTRATIGATLAEAALGLLRRARALVLTGRIRRVDTRRDPASPRSMLYEAGGPPARAAYFALVSAGS